jgi:uridine kinase
MDRASTFFPASIVRIKYRGETLEVPESTTLHSIASSKGEGKKGWEAPIAAIVDGRLMSLEANVYEGADIVPVYAWDEHGDIVYKRSLTVLLQAASKLLYPDVRLMIGQSLAGGYFYKWEGNPPPGEDSAARLEQQMRTLVEEDLPIRQERCGMTRAVEKFREAGMDDRVMLMRTWWHETIRLVRLGEYSDIYHGPVAPSTGGLQYFALRVYPPGMILKFPEGRKGENPSKKLWVVKQLFDVYMETYEWNKIIGISNIGQLNDCVLGDAIDELIRVAEGLHEKKIASIADMAARKNARVILIAGPSSSGKTTFGKRLGVQLKVAGKNPVLLSIDDYYVDREKTPKDEKGDHDFESIYAVDLPLLNQHLSELLRGNEVLTPRYSFEKGTRQPESKWQPMKLGGSDVLTIEGIHALNDKLTSSIPAGDKLKIYVSALSQLGLDDANRISTTDVRFLRRLVRDRLYRGYSAEETIAKWPSVKRGEARNIFPFQGEADVMFNSTLPYELSVLRVYAEKFLLEVPKGSPSFMEAYRLLKFLDLLVPIFPDRVPHNSIIREFIGGSFFHY